jgi:tetratricopeptide (TPR) repeat protein
MAEYHSQRGDGEFAINDMHSALEILPNDMVLRTQLADLALHEDKLDVAETEYKTILTSNPDDPQAILGLAHVGFRKARKDGAYPPGWQKLMDQLQNVVTEQSVKGLVLKGAKNLQEGIQISEAEKSLSQLHFRDARKAFTGVINSHREEPYELLNLGEQAYNDGDLRSAEQAYNFAKQVPDVAPRAEQGMSRIADQRNEAARQTTLGNATWKTPDVAIDHYKQALIADPQFANAYYGLYSLFSRGDRPDPPKAIDNANNFLEAADDSNPLRREVETGLVKLKKKFSNEKKK